MRDKAESYFRNDVEGNSIIDYKDENIKREIIAAYIAGYRQGKEDN